MISGPGVSMAIFLDRGPPTGFVVSLFTFFQEESIYGAGSFMAIFLILGTLRGPFVLLPLLLQHTFLLASLAS